MGLLDTVMSNTVGVLWRAGTGTVDPWTKNQLIDEQAAALQQASGGAPSPGTNDTAPIITDGVGGNVLSADEARAQASQTVNQVLQMDQADPSNALAQMGNSLGRAYNYFTGKNTNLLDPNQPNVDFFSLGMWGLALVAIVAIIFFSVRAVTK